jgi:hypothetical protein
MMEAPLSSERSVLIRTKRRNIPEDGIFQDDTNCYKNEELKKGEKSKKRVKVLSYLVWAGNKAN